MLKRPNDFSFLILGSVPFTSAVYNTGPKKRYGGGIIFGSSTGFKLGINMNGITIGAEDIEPALEILRVFGMKIERIERKISNYHNNDYTVSPVRYGMNQYITDPMMPEEIKIMSDTYDGVFVFPTLDEVSPQVITKYSAKSLVLLDPSGYTRKILDRGNNQYYPVVQKHWDSIDKFRGLAKILKLSDVDLTNVKFPSTCTTIEDKIINLSNNGFPITILTRGRQSTLVCENDQVKSVPVFPVTKIIDVAGAGEAFSIGFVTEYLMTGDAFHSVKFGNICASFHIAQKYFNYDVIQQALK